VAQLFGHEHSSLFKLLHYGNQTKGSIFLNGAISPIFKENPVFRKYYYNSSTMEIVDWEEWFFQVSKPENGWAVLLPSFLSSYRLQSVSPDSLWNFVDEKMDLVEFQDYLNHSVARSTVDQFEIFCDLSGVSSEDRAELCRLSTVCVSKYVREADFTECMSSFHGGHSYKEYFWVIALGVSVLVLVLVVVVLVIVVVLYRRSVQRTASVAPAIPHQTFADIIDDLDDEEESNL